jgi:uncharacterized membrane protein
MSTLASDTELDVSARAAVTIGWPPGELRALWLDPVTQSRIWAHFAHVVVLEDGTADWVALGPAGGQYRWSTQVMEAGASEIRWSSLDGADISNVGTLTLRPAPGDRGTELHLEVQFDPPGGAVGEAVGKLFHIVPREIVLTALYRFRALALTGELPTTDQQPAARHGGSDR